MRRCPEKKTSVLQKRDRAGKCMYCTSLVFLVFTVYIMGYSNLTRFVLVDV